MNTMSMNTGQSDMVQIKFISVKFVNPLRTRTKFFIKIQQNICIIILIDY